MSKWIEYQPVIDELKYEWCNKCNKICPYNNCKIYRVMQILRRQKPIPHTNPQGKWIPNYVSQFANPGRSCSLCGKTVEFSENYCPNCGAYMRGDNNDVR